MARSCSESTCIQEWYGVTDLVVHVVCVCVCACMHIYMYVARVALV